MTRVACNRNRNQIVAGVDAVRWVVMRPAGPRKKDLDPGMGCTRANHAYVTTIQRGVVEIMDRE